MSHRTILVTRHPGAVAWLRQQTRKDIEVVEHFVPTDEPVVVIGILPIHLAAHVCKTGGYYYSLDVDVPQHLRGKELTYEDMCACNARITRYIVAQPWDIVCRDCDRRGAAYVFPR